MRSCIIAVHEANSARSLTRVPPLIEIVSLAMLLLQATLLAYSASVHSPMSNEIGHVPAGLSHWTYGMYDLYRVNPPLPRMVSTLPLLFCDELKRDWGNYSVSPYSREETPMGIRFTKANGIRTLDWFRIARWAGIPFALLGGYVCYLWARRLWGQAAGLLSLTLWCTSPMILGHGALVMPDVPAASLGVTAAYCYWRWLIHPGWNGAFLAGITLGLAQLTKTTLLLLCPLWLVLLAVACQYRRRESRSNGRMVAMFACQLIIALYLLNMGYLFRGSLLTLDSYVFRSTLLSGQVRTSDEAAFGNRFAGTLLGRVPVPFPRDYIYGIDRQKADFEEGERSYLRGNWNEQGGWWYYHVYGLAVKTPIGTLSLLGMAVLVPIFVRLNRRPPLDEVAVLAPAIGVIALVSCNTGFSNHVRYCIPALPFLFIFAGRVSQAAFSRRWLCFPLAICLFSSAVASLVVFPHSLSFFNSLASGPEQGHKHLLESNSACGQDLIFLKGWLDDHPEVDDLYLVTIGWTHPRVLGIEFQLPPPSCVHPANGAQATSDCMNLGPVPGWFAVDVNFLHGSHRPVATPPAGWKKIPPLGPNYEYFRKLQPVASAGYSIYIYHIALEDANRVRHELGLPGLPEEWEREQERVPP